MRDAGNALSRYDVAGECSLYCFDVEPNFIEKGSYLNLIKQGTCFVEAVFQKVTSNMLVNAGKIVRPGAL
jgi:hypothetical protein